jgi:hypothetical protein
LLQQINDLTIQVNAYETLLRELYPKLDFPSTQRVDQTIESNLIRKPGPSRTFRERRALVYPLTTIVHTEEDLNHEGNIQTMGFMGENLEMAWLYRLKRDLDQDCPTPASGNPDRPSIPHLNYSRDNGEICIFKNVDTSHRPPVELADMLVDKYFQVVHPSFPVIGKEVFLRQYRFLYSNVNVRPGKRWLAVLNLIFAVASKYSLLAENHPLVKAEEDLVFFARAWRLSIGNMAPLDHPNLQQVQVEGLASFYLLTLGQVDRSWRVIGIAIRSAVAMGINLRSDTDSVTHLSKETRYRVWWALYMLDSALCVMTGRPPSSNEVFCTTPLPIPYREEDFWNDEIAQLITDQHLRNHLISSLLPSRGSSSRDANTPFDRAFFAIHTSKIVTPNTSLYFLYSVDLAILKCEAIEILYAPSAARRSWEKMEMAIDYFNDQADNWLAHLPEYFNITELDTTLPFIRERACLAFQFYTTKLVISQPCLHRLTNPPTSGSLGSTCDKMAAVCVQVASQMLHLLPDEADASWLYSNSPWWCVSHCVVQFTTVLLIELCKRTQSGAPEAVMLANRVQKALRWLREMSMKDEFSRRAWLVCRDIISRHGLRFALNTDF